MISISTFEILKLPCMINYLTLFELLSKKLAIDTASTKTCGAPSIQY